MDSALIRDRARLRLDELLREAERIESFLQTLEELTEQEVRGECRETGPIFERLSASDPQPSAPQEAGGGDDAHQMSDLVGTALFACPDEIVRNAKEILIEVGRPMVRRELADRLIERGLKLKGRDQARYVGSTLWRFNDVVVHLHGHGYWPVEEPYPPAAYIPRKQSRRSGRRVS